jgi:3-oxoacyl-[acyl-carrier-protein] synthase II
MRRVVITGMGLRTPLGHRPDDLFDALLAGESGVVLQDGWTGVADLQALVAGEITDFDPRVLPRKFRRTMGRVAMFAVASAVDACKQAGIGPELLSSGRVGVAAGSTTGSNSADEDFWRHYISNNSARGLKSTNFFKVMSHTVATNLAMYLRVNGQALSTNAACASATQALGVALDQIRCGRADVMVAGGADELHVAAAITFDSMGGASRAFTASPSQTPRPFDSARDGIVVAEGAGILVLEERDHALARGATVLAEVLGFGGTSDGLNMASPATGAMQRAIRLALADAGCSPEDVGYFNAHATGTPIGDATEAHAVLEVLGDRVPVSSYKGHLGHTLGACGAIEAIVGVVGMQRGLVVHTRNLVEPNVAPIWLPTEPLQRSVDVMVSANFAFGGVNTAIVLGRQ